MALKHALAAALATGLASMMIAARLEYFEESLPTTLNPLWATSIVDYRAQELVFDRLWYHDPITNNLSSRLVQDWSVAEGGTAVKLTIRPGIKWHNGKNLTSKDICFTVNAMLNRNTASPIAEEYRQILAGCDTQGNQNALIRFTKIFHNHATNGVCGRERFDITGISRRMHIDPVCEHGSRAAPGRLPK